jgi:SsrA-binding protein
MRPQQTGNDVGSDPGLLKNGRIKIEVGVARGKKMYDKREAELKRTVERETRAQLKERNR